MCEHKTQLRRQVESAMVSAARGGGCGDHGCIFAPAAGMGTNGGCRCLQGDLSTPTKMALRTAWRIVQALAAGYEAEDLLEDKP